MDERVRSFLAEYSVIILLAVAGIAFLVFGLFHLSSPTNSVVISSESPKEEKSGSILVDVAGAVAKPGLYSLSSNARVADAIQKAGGMAESADLEYIAKVLNKAQIVQDGQKVFIPSRSQEVAGSQTFTQDSHTSDLINVNSASSSELESLPGVGEVTAGKIISNRPYTTLDDLLTRKVVNNSTYEKIKELITIF